MLVIRDFSGDGVYVCEGMLGKCGSWYVLYDLLRSGMRFIDFMKLGAL